MSDLERDLAAAVRRHKAREHAAKACEAERDEAIRRARAEGISQARVMAISGLSRQRVNQIVRGGRL